MLQAVEKAAFQVSCTSTGFNLITHMPQICPTKVAVKGCQWAHINICNYSDIDHCSTDCHHTTE